METDFTITRIAKKFRMQHKEVLHMNMFTMGECIHYEFAENQLIDYVLYDSREGLRRAFGDACRRYDVWDNVYESRNTSGKVDAFGVVLNGMVVQICAYARTNKKNFQRFCTELADVQGHYQAERTAA